MIENKGVTIRVKKIGEGTVKKEKKLKAVNPYGAMGYETFLKDLKIIYKEFKKLWYNRCVKFKNYKFFYFEKREVYEKLQKANDR